MKWSQLLLVCALTATLTFTLIAATPSTAIPVGVAQAEGISMGEPDGTLVIYADAGEPEIGDVVIYWSDANNEYVRHRIVDETDEGFVTQGDTMPHTDTWYRGEYVTDENYVGKEVLSVPPPA